MTRRRMLAALGLGLAVVLAVGAFAFWPRGTTEITEDRAVEDYRSRAGSTTTTAGRAEPTDAKPTLVPAPGVYTYRATGGEEVKLGPLPTEARSLPATVTAVVVDDGGGCFDWTINYFVQHTEDTTWCVDAGGRQLDRHVKHQRIGALAPVATVTCDPARTPLAAGEETDLRCDLVLDGGPASVAATLAGTATAGETEEVEVGGVSIEAVPTTLALTVSGDLTGSWTETTWWSADGLILRVERELDLAGLATFHEASSLVLADRTPTS